MGTNLRDREKIRCGSLGVASCQAPSAKRALGKGQAPEPVLALSGDGWGRATCYRSPPDEITPYSPFSENRGWICLSVDCRLLRLAFRLFANAFICAQDQIALAELEGDFGPAAIEAARDDL